MTLPIPTPDQQLVYLRIAIFVVWGIAGLVAYFNVSREHGWGTAFLMLGAYLALGWSTVRP